MSLNYGYAEVFFIDRYSKSDEFSDDRRGYIRKRVLLGNGTFVQEVFWW